MAFIDSLRYGINVMLHPSKATSKKMSIGDTLRWYYKSAIIPLILGIIVTYAFGGSFLLMTNSLFGGAVSSVSVWTAVGAYIAWVILLPIGVLISAGIYHVIIGMLLKLYKGSYTRVFNAYMYGETTLMIGSWLFSIPVIGAALEVIFSIWALIVNIFGLSAQLQMSKLKALGTLILLGIIVGVIAAVVSLAAAGALFGL